MADWQDLSDSELRARLEQRGMQQEYVLLYVQGRDSEIAADIISGYLE